MEAYAGLVAGSHNRNELVVIRQDGDGVRALLPFLFDALSFFLSIKGLYISEVAENA